MFKRRRSYYTSYRGRRSSSGKKLFIGIAALLLLVAVVGIFLLSDTLVFSADGFWFSFREPKAEDIDPAPVQQDDKPEDFNIVIDGRTVEPDEPPVETSPVFPETLGVSDNIASLLRNGYGESLADAAIAAGCNTLCFTVKDTDGVSLIPVTSSYSSQGSQADNAQQIKDALEALKAEKDIYLAARVSAMCDMLAPRAHNAGAVRVNSGATWLDKYNRRWLNAYSDVASEYVCDMIAACAASGFDVVILDHLCFPVEGRIDLITYGAADNAAARQQAVTRVLEAAAETAKLEDVSLAVVLENEVSDGVSGQDAASMAPYCQTIYYLGAEDAPYEAALAEALNATDCHVGRIDSGAVFTSPAEGVSLIAGRLQ